jgi:predicted alpha/beta-hydrolase family hydrolase
VEIEIPTSAGLGRLVVSAAAEPTAVVWLGHGAGGGIDAVDLAALAATLPAQGITVARFEQPWRVAGKRVAARPETLDAAWLQTAGRLRDVTGNLPIIVGGRSAGARVACRTAGDLDAAGVVCLAFPLHPPGRPDTSRLDELLRPTVPVLVLQGDRDLFGSAAVVADAAQGHRNISVIEVPGADHGMKTLKASPLTGREVAGLITTSVSDFVRRVVD